MLIDTNRVDHARLRSGLFRRELAQKAGVSFSAVQRACQKGVCGVLVARKLAAALGLKVEDIIIDPMPRGARGGGIKNQAVA